MTVLGVATTITILSSIAAAGASLSAALTNIVPKISN